VSLTWRLHARYSRFYLQINAARLQKKYRRGFCEETLFISGVVIDESRLSPEFAVGVNLIFSGFV
jgi:hypothetical protein